MKTLITTLLGFLLYANIIAQNAATSIWADAFGLQDTVLKTPTITDNLGNLYVAGSTINGSSGPDIVIKKYDSNGDPIFGFTYSSAGNNRDQATTINIDNNYNIIIGGFSYVNATNSYDFLVLKYDSTGTLLWTYTYNGTGSGEDFVSAIELESSNIYLTGASVGIASLFDFTTIKLNSAGSVVWNNRYNYLGADLPFDIDIIGSNVYVNGGSQSTITNWDYALLHYSTNGTPIDTIRTTGTGIGFDRATQAVTDNQGNIYITGAYSTATNGLDFKTIKFDQQGNVVWIATYDNTAHQDDIANDIDIDNLGNVYVTGKTFNGSGNYDYCTIKYDNLGNEEWSRIYDNYADDEAIAIVVDNSDNIFVTGASYNAMNSDFATVAYNTDGDTLWSRRLNHTFNGSDIATSIAEQDGIIFVSGQTQVENSEYVNYTVAYSQAEIKEIPDLFGEDLSQNLFYIPNDGQLANDTGAIAKDILFYVPNHYPSLFVNHHGLSYVFSKLNNDTLSNDTIHRIDMQFMKGNYPAKAVVYPNKITSDYFNNYYFPHCQNGVIDVRGSSMLFAKGLYEGIDLYYSSNLRGEKHYLVLAPNANPKAIKIKFNGADSVSTPLGKYSIYSSIGSIEYDSLVAYEIDALGNIIIGTSQPMRLILDTVSNSYYFKTITYNTSNTLVIMAKQKVVNNERHIGQPEWSTYFGGYGYNEGTGVTHDTEGNSYFVGFTSSSDFPTFIGQQLSGFGGNFDAYIAKFGSNYNASQGIVVDGYRQKWTTYYGGPGIDKAYGVSTLGDGTTGKIYITGVTDGSNFPTFPLGGAYNQSANSGNTDAFILRLDAEYGNNPWATHFGGSEDEIAYSIKNDNAGNFYIAGSTSTTSYSSNVNQVPSDGGFPQFNTLTNWNNGGFQGGVSDGFIAKFTNDGVCLWSSYFGGNGTDETRAIALNDNNDVYFTGTTSSTADFPIQNYTGSGTDYYQSTIGGGSDAFIAAFDNGGNQIYTTYFGGSGDEEGLTIICDGLGNTYFAGQTTSSTPACSTCTCIVPPTGQFPLCQSNVNAHIQSTFGGGAIDGYFAKLNSDYNLTWSTYYGGNNDDRINSIDVDYIDRLFFTGVSSSIGDGNTEPNIWGGSQFTNWSWSGPTANGFYDEIIGYFNDDDSRGYASFYGTIFEEASNSISVYSTDPNNVYWYITGFAKLLPDVMTPNGWDMCCPNAYRQEDPINVYTNAHIACFSINDMYMMSVENIGPEITADFLVYPNPTSYNITAKLYLPEKQNVSVEIYNINGMLLSKLALGKSQGMIVKQIDFSMYAKGTYLLKVITDLKSESKKIIKND
jgi:hypothetical protein